MPVKTICCVCHKTRNLNGWLDQFLDQYKKLSHGYCPECFQKTIHKIRSKESQKQQKESLTSDFLNQPNDDLL